MLHNNYGKLQGQLLVPHLYTYFYIFMWAGGIIQYLAILRMWLPGAIQIINKLELSRAHTPRACMH